ncbi:hypothetical protein B0H19DRAFT_1191916 [Mycena capillaripes]|nr:hypothetical protein B0H19DRAFT_1191916 [Mycena capillaripes]
MSFVVASFLRHTQSGRPAILRDFIFCCSFAPSVVYSDRSHFWSPRFLLISQ